MLMIEYRMNRLRNPVRINTPFYILQFTVVFSVERILLTGILANIEMESGFNPESVLGGTDITFLCSAYYYKSTMCVANAARALGKTTENDVYKKRADEILDAIRREFYTAGGRCATATQTGNAISLSFGLAPEFARKKITETLRGLLAMNKGKLKTGFLGTPVLCRALSDNGANAEAYTLLLNEENPGWLYEVNMGATTVWERWNSVMPDGHMSSTGMNSLNHYAYGAVMEWVCRDAAGLAPVEDAPGFRKALMHPHPDTRLGEIDFSYESASTNAAHTANETIAVPILQKIRLKCDEPTVYDDVSYLDSSTSMSIKMYNMGRSSVYNCIVDVEGNGLKLEESYFGGTLSAGSTLAADISVIPSEAGDIQGTVVISYEDVYGEPGEERLPFTLHVEDPNAGMENMEGMEGMGGEGMEGGMTDPGMEGGSKGFPWWGWVIGAGALGGGGFFGFKKLKKRRARSLEDDV